MPKILEPLLLPQLVKARRSSIEPGDADGADGADGAELSSSFPTRNSSLSELSMPVTPTFSLRAHSRYASSVSSTDATSPSLRTLPSLSGLPADALEDSYLGKRSLPDVKEEPVERDDDGLDIDMVDDFDRPLHATQDGSPSPPPWFRALPRPSTPMYDLSDGFVSDGDASAEPSAKKRRGDDSSLATIATRFGGRFPSFSRHWGGRRPSRGPFAADAVAAAATAATAPSRRASQGASSRASSMTSSIANAGPMVRDVSAPRTPPNHLNNNNNNNNNNSEVGLDGEEAIFLEKLEAEPAEADEHIFLERPATTPLLPPVIVPAPTAPAAVRASDVQSPLQSPTVANSPETFSEGVRTPPRSGRLSTSSLAGPPVVVSAASQVPTSDIPNIRLAEPDDEWSSRLGHANFDIHPEPYTPDAFNAEACRQIRANWELARCNYIKHLIRTGAHYGDKSKTYRLTEQKWAEIDAEWKARHDETVARAGENGSLALSDRNASPLPEPSMTVATMVPSLSGPRSDGKFPQLGNEDIVGPMVVQASSLPSKPSFRRRRGPATILRFIGDVRWPGVLFGVGARSGRSRTT